MKIVMAFGTFDIFHQGHASYLEQAKKLGTHLIVVVARDKTVFTVKGRGPKNNERKRAKVVRESQLAQKVVLGNLKDRYRVIKKFRPDVIALGYDQAVDLKEVKNKLREFDLKTRIVRLKSHKPEIYKSSKLQQVK